MDQFEPHLLHLLRTEPGNIHRQSIAAPVPLLRNSSGKIDKRSLDNNYSGTSMAQTHLKP